LTCDFATLGGGWQAVLTITDRAIRSTVTSHTAERASAGGEDGWRVSWLTGRVLSAAQAQAAMLIAEAAGDVDADCDPELYDEGFWSRLDAWAAQLGMPGPAALAQAAAVPAGELTPMCRAAAGRFSNGRAVCLGKGGGGCFAAAQESGDGLLTPTRPGAAPAGSWVQDECCRDCQ
jgi:hypothetical protein